MVAVNAKNLMSMSQTELDELYRNSPIGAIPVGEARGTTIVAPGTLIGKIATPLIRLLFWQGKVFNSAQRDLLNKISPLRLRAIRAQVYVGESWFDGKEAIVLDYSKTSFLAQKIRDEIRQVAPGFYLGKVYWGKKWLLDFSLLFRGNAR
jgi:hypothetical protein